MAELSLVLATIQSADSAEATRALVDAGLRATVLNSVGGFLRMNNVTLLLGAGRSDIPRAISLLSAHCRKRTVFINAHGDIASGYIAPSGGRSRRRHDLYGSRGALYPLRNEDRDDRFACPGETGG